MIYRYTLWFQTGNAQESSSLCGGNGGRKVQLDQSPGASHSIRDRYPVMARATPSFHGNTAHKRWT